MINKPNTNSKYFGRKWEVSVTMKNGSPKILSSSDIPANNLHCIFSSEKSIDLYTYSDATIYNLKKETITEILSDGINLRIAAGYQNGNYQTICDQPILQYNFDKRDGTDYLFTIHSINSLGMVQNQISFTSGMKRTLRDELNVIGQQAKTKVQVAPPPSDTGDTLFRRKVYFGTMHKYLKEYSKFNNTLYTYDDVGGKLLIGKELVNDKNHKLTLANGLIGSPVQTELGANFKCLLNPTLNIFNSVEVDHKQVLVSQYPLLVMQNLPHLMPSKYYVIKVTHIGDTRGNNWESNIIGGQDQAAAFALYSQSHTGK
jgi:hypothetical protein